MATSFNLEQAIKNYLESIATAGSLLPDDAKELTSHLHDSVVRLTAQGLSAEEAFIVATKRLGTQQQLATEYAKVNPSVMVNRIWSYLLVGFAGLTGVFGLGNAFLVFVYSNALKAGDATLPSLFLVAAVHLALCFAVGMMVYRKRAIAVYLERRIQRRPLLMLVNASLLMVGAAWVQQLVKRNALGGDSFTIALYRFQDRFVEFTFYLLLFMLLVGVISMFLTVKDPEKATLKRVFSRPAIGFLLLAGFATELLAASTRVLPPHDVPLISGLYFGAVYFVGAFAISYYNHAGAVKYLCWYALLGLSLEVIVGIRADLLRIQDGMFTILTPYFVSGLLVGLIVGYITGRFFSYRLSLTV